MREFFHLQEVNITSCCYSKQTWT